MFDNFDLSKVGELLNQVKERAGELEKDLADKVFTAKAGAGMVEVRANGRGEFIDVLIDDSLLEDKASLQILLIAALNDLQKIIVENRNSTISNDLLGGFKL